MKHSDGYRGVFLGAGLLNIAEPVGLGDVTLHLGQDRVTGDYEQMSEGRGKGQMERGRLTSSLLQRSAIDLKCKHYSGRRKGGSGLHRML